MEPLEAVVVWAYAIVCAIGAALIVGLIILPFFFR